MKAKRIGRWLFNLTALLSLIFLITIVVLWVRSYSTRDRFYLRANAETENEHDNLQFFSTKGSTLTWIDPDSWRSLTVGWETKPAREYSAATGAGFSFHNYSKDAFFGPTGIMIMVPHWFLALIASVLPVIGIVRFGRRRKLLRAGTCPLCHYNLTGNVSGMCPECGSKIDGSAG